MNGNNILDRAENWTAFNNDWDNDGIINDEDPDDDNDNISDIKEWKLWTNPSMKDTDGDWLSDFEELTLDTNPLNYDSDNDGLWDNEEVSIGTDPWSQDTDGDGLSDTQEIYSWSNPLNPDEDNDGISDLHDTRKNFRIIWDISTPLFVRSGKVFHMNAWKSYDKDGIIMNYEWDIQSKIFETAYVDVVLKTILPFKFASWTIYGEDDSWESSQKKFYFWIYNLWSIILSILFFFFLFLFLRKRMKKTGIQRSFKGLLGKIYFYCIDFF